MSERLSEEEFDDVMNGNGANETVREYAWELLRDLVDARARLARVEDMTGAVAALKAENDAMRAALQEISSWPGTTLGEPVEAGSNRDTPENRAFQRGLNMAFARCAALARATPGAAADARGEGK